MTYTEQQVRYYQELVHGKTHIILNALAGTGKTTTILDGLRYVDLRGMRVLLAAFDSQIKQEMERRARLLGLPDSIWIRTYNSLGYYVCNQNLTGLTVSPDMALHWVREELKKSSRRRWPKLKDVARLIELAKAYLVDTREGLKDLIEQFDLDISPGEVTLVSDLVLRRLELSLATTDGDSIDFADQLWLPLVRGWELPQFDLIIVDEAQDTNKIQRLFVERCNQGRMVFVGDPNQAIYAFRGADANSMVEIERMLEATAQGVTVLPLSTTFRCGKAQTALAQVLVPAIEAHPSNPDGELRTASQDEIVAQSQPGDMVLSRMNAPLFSLACRLLSTRQVPVIIAGRDFGKMLMGDILKVLDNLEMEAPDTPMHTLFAGLKLYFDAEIEKANKRYASQRHRAEKAVGALQEREACITAISEGCVTAADLLTRLKNLCVEEGDNCIRLSTIHRAKGREANRVWIIATGSMPSPYADTPSDREQERNLIYVALTRSKLETRFEDAPPAVVLEAFNALAARPVDSLSR